MDVIVREPIRIASSVKALSFQEGAKLIDPSFFLLADWNQDIIFDHSLEGALD